MDSFVSFKDNELAELQDMSFIERIRMRPPPIDELVKETKFDKHELKMIYHGFKQNCPTGTVTKTEMKQIFAHIFPQGNPDMYADIVFNTIDTDRNDYISFEEFVKSLSIISKGSLEEKLDWIFQLYDVRNSGEIVAQDLDQVLHAIYLLLGKNVQPPVTFDTVPEHSKFIQEKYFAKDEHKVNREQFQKLCMADAQIRDSFECLQTCLYRPNQQ